MILTVDGAHVHAATGGKTFDGSLPTVLFLHGSGLDHRSWALQTRWFAFNGFSVLAPDFPAHSLSKGQPLSTIEESGAWLVRFLDAAELSAAHVVGHSQGFLSALELAYQAPERVLSLSGVGSAAAIPVNAMLVETARKSASDAADMMVQWGFGQRTHMGVSPTPGMQPIALGKQIMRANPLAADLQSCADYQNGMRAIASVNQPCAMILAGQDKMTPCKAGQAAADALGAQTTVLPSYGHMLPIEAPKQVLQTLRGFISQLAQPKRYTADQTRSEKTIRKVAVIGAGTMGAGIAGQVANAGVHVWLLDLPSEGEAANALAEQGLQRLRDTQGLMSDEHEKFIHLGNTRDDFTELADCDWIAEAVVERLDVKRELYRQIAEACSETAMISSNTSTIPIKLLVEGMPLSFRQRFAITHFFNPVRFMPLLELVRGEDTQQAVMDKLGAFCDQQLGKGVIDCLDTPGFLGNRVGCYAIQTALQAAFDMGLSPVQADAIFGRPMGIPKTGVFGLYDLIGIDLMSDVAQSLVNTLPEYDAFHAESGELPLMAKMIANGQTGNKQGQGFYRLANGKRQVMDLDSGEHVDAERLDLAIALKAEREGVMHLLNDDSIYGQFAWRVLSRTLVYAASLIPEVGDDPVGIDDAMKLGYNWVKGPFELIDEVGVSYLVDRLKSEGRHVPAFLQSAYGSEFYRVEGGQASRMVLEARNKAGNWKALVRAEGVNRFTEMRRTLVAQNTSESASWFDIDGIAMVEFHSKANALDGDSMMILADAIDAIDLGRARGLIVHNDAQHFSCGVNLQAVRRFFQAQDMNGLDAFLSHFQNTVQRMSVLNAPVVCAPVGLSLGGGFEVVLHAKQVVCHANSTMGLVESGVGLVPAGGGCKETLYRWLDQLGEASSADEAAWKAFMNLGYGRTCSSPILATEQAMLRPTDRFLSNRDRLLNEAIVAVNDGSEQQNFRREPLAMPGEKVFHAMCDWLAAAKVSGKLTPHNVVVATELARIVTGGDVSAGTLMSEQDLYDAERRAFLNLVQTDATQERINSMLDTGSVVQN